MGIYRHVDISHLDQMIDGSALLLADLIERYAGQFPQIFAQLTQLNARGDYAQLARLAHKAKGSASMLGIMGLAKEMKRLEECAQQGQASAEIQGYIARYREVSQLAMDELNAILRAMQLK